MNELKLTNSYIPLIVPSVAAPVVFFYMKQYMESVLPLDLVAAARVDGSGEFRTAPSALSAQGWRLHPPWKRSTKPRARMHAGRTVRGLAQLERTSSLFCVPLLPGPDLPRQLGLQALF